MNSRRLMASPAPRAYIGCKKISQIQIENCAVRDIHASLRHVRFGSKADIRACPRDVRFTPESGH
jgi:hypothetical protein